MAWRLHLTNQSIYYLDILDGDPPLLATRVRRNKFAFHHIETGVKFDDLVLEPPEDASDRQSDEWRAFLQSVAGPNQIYIPLVEVGGTRIYSTEDGGIRLYQTGPAALHLNASDREATLDREDAERFVAVAMDRLLGMVVALDEVGKVHIFQQHRRVGAFDQGLTIDDDRRPTIAVARGGSAIYVCDGRRVVLIDSAGRLKTALNFNYMVRRMACSPDGKTLVTCDEDIGLLRIYSGEQLTLTHQRFAIDLVSHATQVQLMAEMPPAFVAPGALRIDNAGQIALAMSGVICVTDLEHMDAVPRQQEVSA